VTRALTRSRRASRASRVPIAEQKRAGFRVAIAGAGDGIGAACARALAGEGARLSLCARTEAGVESLAAELRARGADASAVVADLSTDAGAEAFAEASFRALGDVDLGLICVGAAQRPLALAQAGRALLLAQLEGNALAPALAAGALLRGWAARPRTASEDRQLIFLSSLVTRRPPLAGAAPYTAAKMALEALVRAIAEEHWPGVRANALCLGSVATRMHQQAGTPPELIAQFPTADEVAPLVLFLAGPAARGLTGRAIDAEALAREPSAALLGDGRLASIAPLQPTSIAPLQPTSIAPLQRGSIALLQPTPIAPLQPLSRAEPEVPPEAEPGRRPSPKVRRALRATADSVQRYPSTGAQLASRLEGLHGAPAGSVALSGGGASELLERALRAFCSPGDEVVSPFPTFELLSALCSRQGLRHRPVPSPRLADGLFGSLRAAPLLEAIGPRTRLVYLASPDNPTGALLPGAEEAALLERLPRGTVLLVDEAWAGPALPPLHLPEGALLLRLRSFSKLHGLAALRVGYAVGAPEAIALLQRLQLPYPLGAPQLAAVQAVLDEPERTRRAALLLSRERARLAHGLRALGLFVSAGNAPMLLLRDPSAGVGRIFFALQAAGATVQEAHWDPRALVLALGTRGQNRRSLLACARAMQG
jgi:histidinol-phosphate aminotransferase